MNKKSGGQLPVAMQKVTGLLRVNECIYIRLVPIKVENSILVSNSGSGCPKGLLEENDTKYVF